jgi:hypothetical protein
MAKCDLSIELDDPQKVYTGGDTISGVVRVRADADVKCKALEVSSGWKTHGRGNVASETAATVELFAGEWVAGAQSEYRFELPVSDWPPSYHGHYLNVDHYIDARAKIPWGFDPKASVPFLMQSTGGSQDAVKHSSATEVGGVIGCLIIACVVALFLGIGGMIAVATFPIGMVFFVAIGGIGFLFWLFKVFLPKYLLGEVKYFLAEDTVSPGQSVRGELVIQPRKNVQVNAVTVNFEAREQCVSGSGSNRKTHKNVIFEQLETLQGQTTLSAGKEHRFHLNFTLPENAPYSLDLDDNDLIWGVGLHVDIPRWPDWKKELVLTVVPAGGDVRRETPADSFPVSSSQRPVAAPIAGNERASSAGGERAPSAGIERASSDGGEITFAETVQHLWESREDREQIEMLAEAVTGLSFEMEAIVERRLLYSGDEDPHLYPDGYAVWAHHSEPPLPMVLYVPHELADEFENIGRDLWRGRGTIVGWDSRHGRLQVKIEQP